MMLATQAVLAASAAAIALLSITGMLAPWPLLALTFALGSALAIGMPAWITATPDAVEPAFRLQAVGLNSVSYNAARAVGPALAGAMIAVAGVHAVFLTTLVIALAVMFIVWRYCPPWPPSTAGGEPVGAALRSGLRYARHSPMLHACFGRTVLFVVNGSALWALLPLVAHQMPGDAASSYAWMLGSMGAGAVVSGLLLGRLRAAASLQRLVNCAALLFAVGTTAAAATSWLWLLVPALFFAGSAWVASGATLMAVIQTSLPHWVRARVVALQMLLFQGSMAVGSVLWGAIANEIGIRTALLAAAAMICVGQLVSGRWGLRLGRAADTAPAGLAPEAPAAWTPAHGARVVAVEIEYFVREDAERHFLVQIHKIGLRRKRNGARFWRLYRDINDRSRMLERFVVDSWDDYLRQGKRCTVADAAAEEDLEHCLVPGSGRRIAHYTDESLPQP